MSFARSARFVLLLSPAIGLIAFVVWNVIQPVNSSTQSRPDGSGRLVVLVVFDQMRGDYLERWKAHFGADGFEKFKQEGVWFSNAMLPYAASSTAPGHASLMTGTTPDIHGIVENSWFDRSRGKNVVAATDDTYERVPRSSTENRERVEVIAPTRLLAPTVGDALREHNTASKVVSISLKDRAAVMMGGKEPSGVYCFDSALGEFHTSSYYRESIPDWMDEFDRKRIVYQWSGKVWDRLKTRAIYDEFGPDDQVGEGGRSFARDRVFPYPLPEATDRKINYFDRLEYSAFGNDLLWEFTKSAIRGEKLGQNQTTDLLCISFSSNDMLGHLFGPDSHETMDLTLRSDQLIADLLQTLEETVGPNRYAVVIAADHGICPLPEVAIKTHLEAKRANVGEFLGGLDEYLDKVFGRRNDVPNQWVHRESESNFPWVYLNRRTIEMMGRTEAEVQSVAAGWLRERPTPLVVLTREQLIAEDFPTDDARQFGLLVKRSFHPDRCGDLYLIPPPYVLPTGNLSQGTNHGSPHDYDRSIPILAFGAGVPRLGEQKDPTSSLIVAPLLSKLLGIAPPNRAEEKLPAKLLDAMSDPHAE